MNNKTVKKFDKNNNCIYSKYPNDRECWRKFNEKNLQIYYKNSAYEEWKEYDENNRLIYYKNIYYLKNGKFFGDEYWWEYDKKGNKTDITKRMEYIKKNHFTRFEIMDI